MGLGRPKGKTDSKPRRKNGESLEDYELRLGGMVNEEPKIEEPKTEEPKIEEPKIEEPKIEYSQSSDDNDNDIFSRLAEYDTEVEAPEAPEVESKGSENSKTMPDYKISGMIMLGMIDFFAPGLFLYAYKNFINKKASKVDSSKIRLTDLDKRELKEVADIVADQYLHGFSPLLVLGMGLATIYTSNIEREISKHG